MSFLTDQNVRPSAIHLTVLCICGLMCLFLPAAKAVESPQERHVVVVVWDGMRPDSMAMENTPTLWKLAQEGVVFRNHHPVYLSATNINGVALATGMYPEHGGLIANHEFRPNIDGRKPVDVEDARVVAKGDELSEGNYIRSPTLAELVQATGKRTVIAASKTVGLLHDRPNRINVATNSATVSAGSAWPNELTTSLVKMLGMFPKGHQERDEWTRRALTDVLWNNSVPTFSLLWLSQPDLTQHETAPGAPAAVGAVRGSDDHLAAVLASLDRYKVRDATDVIVVSDHGFSTIQRKVELPTLLSEAGFKVSTQFKTDPQPGEVMLVGGGGSVLLYVIGHEATVVHRLVEFLQKSDFTGVIFTREQQQGAFTLDQGKIHIRDAPDVVMAFRWNDRPNQYGAAGMIDADWQRAAGKGTHATLSRFDMHNLLVAAGPDFRRGSYDDVATGNVDLAPTILRLLRIPVIQPMDGRVLSEALVQNDDPSPKARSYTIEARRQFPTGAWHQWLRVSEVGTTTYFDEGNGMFEGTLPPAFVQ